MKKIIPSIIAFSIIILIAGIAGAAIFLFSQEVEEDIIEEKNISRISEVEKDEECPPVIYVDEKLGFEFEIPAGFLIKNRKDIHINEIFSALLKWDFDLSESNVIHIWITESSGDLNPWEDFYLGRLDYYMDLGVYSEDEYKNIKDGIINGKLIENFLFQLLDLVEDYGKITIEDKEIYIFKKVGAGPPQSLHYVFDSGNYFVNLSFSMPGMFSTIEEFPEFVEKAEGYIERIIKSFRER